MTSRAEDGTAGDAGAETPLRSAVRAWIESDPDPDDVAELESLLADGRTDELQARFVGRLEFGTAGLRGPLGAGPARMNLAVVRTTTAGLCRWLDQNGTPGPVVVGYDARHRSREFARDTAATVAATGREAWLSPDPCPTPLVAHAARANRAAAAVVVTASHNPAADNGYKVYDSTGSQIVPPSDAEISSLIAAAGPADEIPTDEKAIAAWPERVVDDYVAMALGALEPASPRDLRIVYTPVHGVGRDLFLRCLDAAGFAPPIVVAEQSEPDPDFPTAPFPNPEEPGVLDIALARARSADADLVVAHDPDADRLAVALPDPETGSWRRLTGDDVGALLGWHRLTRTRGEDRVVASSVVSARWLERIADGFSVPHRTTLTGFKWVSRAGDDDGRRLVFGYEEALGYAVTPDVRDKDGITAGLAFVELAAGLAAEGRTIQDLLAELAFRFEGSATAQLSPRFDGPRAAERMAEVMTGLREHPPKRLGGDDVVAGLDLLTGQRFGTAESLRRSGLDGLDLPAADVIWWDLGGGTRVLVRPSGTEPKVKCYIEVPLLPAAPDREALVAARAGARAHLEELRATLRSILDS